MIERPAPPVANTGSGRAGRIVILVHETDAFEKMSYYMCLLAQLWREKGFHVTVQRGLGPKLEADLLILHVDLTVVPREYVDYARQYPVVLNGAAIDISKRAISQGLVGQGDTYPGPVIVKTNLNCKGLREATLARKKTPFPRAFHRLRMALPAKWRPFAADYQVYSSPADVPVSVWSDTDLIVEQFRPERSGKHYVARTYHFLGDQEICNIVYSNEPVMRPGNIVHRESTSEIPEGLRKRRADLNVDFGKMDYVVLEGEVMVFDVNRTPTTGDVAADEVRKRVELLSEGLAAFLPFR